jgi:anaphase-promoting complex subunit 1
LVTGVCDNTRKICRLYDILLGGDGKAFESAKAAQQQSRAPTPGRRNAPEEATVFAIVEEGLTQKDIEVLPFGVALPLQEAIAKCRVNPPSDWPVSAYTLIGRDDIAVQFSANTDVSHYLHRVRATQLSTTFMLNDRRSPSHLLLFRTRPPRKSPTSRRLSSTKATTTTKCWPTRWPAFGSAGTNGSEPCSTCSSPPSPSSSRPWSRPV